MGHDNGRDDAPRRRPGRPRNPIGRVTGPTLGQLVRDYIDAHHEGNASSFARAIGQPDDKYVQALTSDRIGTPSLDRRREIARAIGISHLEVLAAVGEIDPNEVPGLPERIALGPLRGRLLDLALALTDHQVVLLVRVAEQFARERAEADRVVGQSAESASPSAAGAG